MQDNAKRTHFFSPQLPMHRDGPPSANGLPPIEVLAVSGAAGDHTAGVPLIELAFHALPVPTCLVCVDEASVLSMNPAWASASGVRAEDALAKGLAVFEPSLRSVIVEAWRNRLAPSALSKWSPTAPGVGGSHPAWRLQCTALPAPQAHLALLVLLDRVAGPSVVERPSESQSGTSAEIERFLVQQLQVQPDIERLARVGHWTNADGTNEVVWSPGMYRIAGLPLRVSILRQVGRSGIHAEDKAAWLAAREALDGRDVEYRWTRPDGEVRWLRSRMGRTHVQGQSKVAFGVVQDITEEREAKLALANELGFVNNIAAHVPGAIYRARRAADGTPSVSFVSPSSMDVLGVRAADVLADQRVFFSNIVAEDLPILLGLMDRSTKDLSTMRAAFRADIPNRGRRWIQAEAATQREPDGAIVWHGFITDVTDHLESAKALERQHRMLQAVQKAQAAFIELEDKRKAFEGLLASFLNITDSAFGFVGEVLYDAKEQPFLRMRAITNIAWDDASRKIVSDAGERGVEFHGLHSLFGHALRTGETVVSNDPKNDERACGLPPGHPPLNSFLAVPITLSGKLIAMVGLANKPDGFDHADEAFLQPLLGTVREFVMATRAHAERSRARLQFQATSALLAEKSGALQATFDSMSQGLIMVDAAGRVRFYNRRLMEMLNLPESLLVGAPHQLEIAKFQQERGDFHVDPRFSPVGVQADAYEDPSVEPPQRYVRRTREGLVIEVHTRLLPEGGYVRTFTDVTTYVDTQEALSEERQRLQWVLEATRPGIWEVNLETLDNNLSARWAEMLGYSLAELAPTTVVTWERLVHPDDLPKATRLRQLHLQGDAAYYECDLRMRHKNGHWMWVNDRGRVHRRDENGRALYMSGTLLDIHERVAAQEEVRSLNASLERRVTERTAELERSMKDMEAISYSIAHDLRAPLRSVNGFASLIAEDDTEKLSPESRRMFERISISSRNMGQMITDMLELLRVVRVELNAVPVDMNALAHSVSEALAPSAPNALIGVKPLPKVMGDATLLRQVLVNLVDNALKYSKHLPQAELVLGFDDRQRAFYLRDNGMGFDMARAGKLFGLFQRMHANSEVPGTGVGLAIVARIVERHGGRIWAEAAPGKGATFWWTLPRG
jgi:PAS domain S-box-containing protein